MSETTQPWWASAPEATPTGGGSEAVDCTDPVEAFRAARRPRPVPPRAARDTATRRDAPYPPAEGEAATGPAGAERAGQPSSHRPELCGVCPLCTLARALEDTRPELLEHLTEAARHLAAAARSLLESPPGDAGAASPSRSPHHHAAGRARGGVERIALDPRGGDDTDVGRAGPT